MELYSGQDGAVNNLSSGFKLTSAQDVGMSAAEILTLLLTVDGTGSGLDADLLDGVEGTYYLDSANFTGTNWTDLTDAGATTLHKHDHGGMDGLGDDDHTIYAEIANTETISAAWTFTADPILQDGIGINFGTGSDFKIESDGTDLFLFDGSNKVLAIGIDEPANHTHASGAGSNVWLKGQGAFAGSGLTGGDIIVEPGTGDAGGSSDGVFKVNDPSGGWWTSMSNNGGTALFNTNGSTLIFQVSSGNNVLNMNASRITCSNNYEIAWGGDNDVRLDYSTAQTNKGGILAFGAGTSDQAYNFIMTSLANRNKNHDHGVGTDPTLFIHSATDPDTDNTEWLGLSHNQTNGLITCGGTGLEIGSSANPLNDLYLGEGVTDATPPTVTIHGTGSSANGTDGGDLQIIGGLANQASDAGGRTIIRGALAGTGTTAETLLATETDGMITVSYALRIQEAAAALADAAGMGQYWVQNAAPCRPMFTDDAGGDFDLISLSSDTTPQLSADLDCNGNDIDNIGGAQVKVFMQDAEPTANNYGDLWYETDRNMWWFWSDQATDQWLSCTLYSHNIDDDWSGNTINGYVMGFFNNEPDADNIFLIHIVDFTYNALVVAPNDANNYWNVSLRYIDDQNSTPVTLSTLNTNGNTAGDWVQEKAGINLTYTPGTTVRNFNVIMDKAGSGAAPGAIVAAATVTYRLVHV